MTSPATTPWILGLTGGIGSGKSAAAQCFVDLESQRDHHHGYYLFTYLVVPNFKKGTTKIFLVETLDFPHPSRTSPMQPAIALQHPNHWPTHEKSPLHNTEGSLSLQEHHLQGRSRRYSISRSSVNAKAKRRQYRRTASEADKVHV